MKKVATITFHRSDNYGSVLQAYALQRTMDSLGYDNYIIDYRKKEVDQLYRIIKPWNSRYNIITNFYSILYYRALKNKKQKYEVFRQNYLILSNNVYKTKSELINTPPHADCFCTGSDQVWNTGIVDFDESYLLDFVKEGKKISYAASGIIRDIDAVPHASFNRLLSDFFAISVREKRAKKVLEKDYAGNIDVVLDPVLLLPAEEWSRICQRQILKEKYMLCYFAGVVSRDFENYSRSLAKKLRLKRVLIMPEWRNIFRSGVKKYSSGPLDFVSLIKNAEYICTNSFHGTAFSVLFNKKFIVDGTKGHIDDRVKDLLLLCKLSDRIFRADKNLINCFVEPDFMYSTTVLEKERKRCKDWIISAIEG